jgi:hypothetical protein
MKKLILIAAGMLMVSVCYGVIDNTTGLSEGTPLQDMLSQFKKDDAKTGRFQSGLYGPGGSVTQITSRSTGVTLSKRIGTITTDTTSLAALAAATFTVTNTKVAVGDLVLVCQRSGATNVKTDVRVTAVAAGTFNITVHNIDASTAETGAIIIEFRVLKLAGY